MEIKTIRKGQKNILERARRDNFSEPFINILSREDLTINELERVYDFMYCRHFGCPNSNNKDKVIEEINNCLALKPLVKTTKSYQLKFDELLVHLLPYKNQFIDIQEKHLIIDFNNTYILLENMLSNSQNEDVENFRAILRHYCRFVKTGLSQLDIKKLMNMLEKKISKEKAPTSFYIDSWLISCIYFLLETDIFLREFSKRQENSLIWIIAECEEEKNQSNIVEKIIDIASKIDIFESNIDYGQFINANNTYDLSALYMYMKKLYINNNPILKQLYNTFIFEHENGYRSYYDIFNKKIYEDEEKAKLLLETANQTGTNLKVYNFGTLQYTIIIPKNYIINLYINLYNSLWIANNEINSCGAIEKHIIITPNGYIYIKNKEKKSSNKVYPMPISDFIKYMKLLNKYEKDINVFNIIWGIYKASNNIFKDIQKDTFNSNCLVPLSVNELNNYHNKSELIIGKYKSANNLKIRWNKININLSYMIIKSLPYVDEKGKQILLNTRDTTLLTEDIKGTFKNKVKYFLINILCKSINIDVKTKKELMCVKTGLLKNENINVIKQDVQDYVSMCLERKIKIKLNIKTVNELKNKHDLVNAADYEKETGIVKVPKDTIFKDLEKILPKGFEWIKTRKRLIVETKLQNHCVWNYANKITEDKCAIYSYVDDEGKFSADGISKRYTIEFNYKNGRYIVRQTQGQYDKVNTSNFNQWLKNLLEEHYIK